MQKVLTQADIALITWSAIAPTNSQLCFKLVHEFGPVKALKWARSVTLELEFPDIDPFMSEEDKLTEKANLDMLRQELQRNLGSFNLAHELELLEQLGGHFITREDPDYPQGLYDLWETRPYVLYVLGQMPEELSNCVAIVGNSHDQSVDSSYLTSQLASELSHQGYTVVSNSNAGVALEAMLSTFYVNKAPVSTVVVMPSGLSNLYPPKNKEDLETLIQEKGCIVTEFIPSTPPSKQRIIASNRLTAALGIVNILIEATENSNAIEVIKIGQDIGRKIGVFPGPVTSEANKGSNKLIQEEAFAVLSNQDVLDLVTD